MCGLFRTSLERLRPRRWVVTAIVVEVPFLTRHFLAQQLIKHVTPLIAKFKVPAYIKLVNEPLPATPSGKILKRELRGVVGEEAAKKLGGEFAAKL